MKLLHVLFFIIFANCNFITYANIINVEESEQPELNEGFIKKANSFSKEDLIDTLKPTISFDISQLIRILATTVNAGIKGGEQVNHEFLTQIAITLKKSKEAKNPEEIEPFLLDKQKFKDHVGSVIIASPKEHLFPILWIGEKQAFSNIKTELEFQEAKEMLIAKLESLVITYLECFSRFTTNKNILQSLTLIIRYGSLSNEEQGEVMKALYEMANNSVGKLLLYRILIEIKKAGGVSLYITSAPAFFNVAWDRKNKIYGLGLSPALAKKLNFPVFSNASYESTLMHEENEPDLDLAIFHEMVHLFHKLNNFERSNNYTSGKNSLAISDIRMHPLFLYYYGNHKSCNLNDETWKTSLSIWNQSMPDNSGRVNFEEMITICGLPETATEYIIGDELSENLYRASKKLPLRFGHKLFTFVESKAVRQKVIDYILYYYNKFKELGSLESPVLKSEKAKTDYDLHSLGMVKADGIEGMYFYTIPRYVSRDKSGLFKLFLNDLYIRKDASNKYYYQKDCCCKTIINSLKLD